MSDMKVPPLPGSCSHGNQLSQHIELHITPRQRSSSDSRYSHTLRLAELTVLRGSAIAMEYYSYTKAVTLVTPCSLGSA